MISSIATMASAMQQEQLESEANTKVAKMALDSAKAQGDALVEMIEMQKEIYQHLGKSVNTWV